MIVPTIRDRWEFYRIHAIGPGTDPKVSAAMHMSYLSAARAMLSLIDELGRRSDLSEAAVDAIVDGWKDECRETMRHVALELGVDQEMIDAIIPPRTATAGRA